jgi:agmatinase
LIGIAALAMFTIPGNNEKSFDQISKGIAHIFSSGAFPIILGGDHSIGFPTVRGVCRHLGDKKVEVIHFDRHVDTQETDLDERMQPVRGFTPRIWPMRQPKTWCRSGLVVGRCLDKG